MQSRAKFLGHSIHQQLIPFPFGLLVTAAGFDVLYLLFDKGELANVSYWMIAAGLVGGALAWPFGTIDWLAIPRGTRAKAVGLLHGAGNTILLALFLASWLLRRDASESPEGLALALSFAGVGLAIITGWLGGELVDRHAVGVDEGAHLNSPHSLSSRAASEDREPAPSAPGLGR